MPASTQPPSTETRVNTSDRERHGTEQLRPEIDLRVDALLEIFRSRRDLAGDLVATPGVFVCSRPARRAVHTPIADSSGQRGFNIYRLGITWTLFKSEPDYRFEFAGRGCCGNCTREIRSCA